ncbi:MAG: THUMP domain-containing protein [Casimicrobiaceae bacterium]|nr:THUMP domain-containing protein [Casimicrobiaceae bacterium]MCX8097581.1 THUMP domain-containing protein [Casimicrobiaceae bacterium]MDW8312085.1 THUMP domain-containing protein [Burkholderiales bacterium]
MSLTPARGHPRLSTDRLESFFAPCPRGLEAVLARELETLGAVQVQATAGGVAFRGPFVLGSRVCLWSRVASRVLWRLAEGFYQDESDLYQLARAVDWPSLFSPRETIRVEADAVGSPLRSIHFAALRIKDAVVDRFRATVGTRPSVETARPDIRIRLFVSERSASIYLDLAGEALFKRGYRRVGLEAPLRENLAAGLLLLEGWHGERVFFDPMMGSGTLLCEAAMIATDQAPGLGRRFAFERLAGHDRAAWQVALEEARARLKPLPAGLLFGGDERAEALAATEAHLRAVAQVEPARADRARAWMSAIALHQMRVEDSVPPPTSGGDILGARGLVLSNAPYGQRLDDRCRLSAWYPSLGRWMKRSLVGWVACFLTADRGFPAGVGLRPRRRIVLFNGPIECRLYEFELYEGSRRPSLRPCTESNRSGSG